VSWTNKAFLSVLTTRSSRLVWIAAFNNIPKPRRPPPCPEDLTEIVYANLLYNPRCMVRVRGCAFCFTWLIRESRVVVHRRA